MKLYVWNEPYGVDYGGSCLYAIAPDECSARALAEIAGVARYGYEPNGTPRGLRDLGPPSRVHDLPYAEIYEWSE